ncbi:ATP-binding protein [Faecalibacterium prausnitzii]|uniref:ATP-binding protein n=1 Tax=Faecalibacterium prausnitzii TaxID=853 RepID=UPI0018CC6F26|nr:ATP-binding protein [Faecalibacterium prausnitzii]
MNLQTLKIKKRAGDTMPFPLDHYIEASHVDYKERLEEKKPRSWLKSVSAFANTEGGHLIFGVKNEPREVVGLENPQAVVSRLTELIKVRIDPTPRYRVREIEMEGKPCVDLEVQDGPAYPYYYAFDGSHTAYVRHGDQSEEATSRELNELILQGMNQTFDALPSSYRVGDVSFTLLAATFKNLKKEDFDLEKDLPSAGLVTDDGQITNGGLLLCDQGVLKQSRIFCTRWKGNYKGSIEEDALDDKEFQGASLITLLQNAEDFVRNNSKNPWSIRGMTREERSDYPYKAVREVLVNALIHRNYQILGSEIHVEVFDDRLEITSPGGMMNGRRVQDMDIRHIPSMRRNQVISDVFSRLGFMERRGSGIDRILNSYVEVAQKPTFYSDSDFFIVTLPNRSVATPAQVSMESVEAQPAKVSTSSKKVATSTLEVVTPQKKVATSTLKVATSQEKVATSEKEDMDSEVANFKNQLDGTNFGSRTKEKTLGLFKRYRYEYSFHSINVAQFFDVKISRANAIIRDLRRLGIVESPQYGVYQFIRK